VLALVLGVVFSCGFGGAVHAELTGEVRLVRRGRTVRGDLESALVFFTPDRATTVQVPKEPFEMKTVDKSFEPRVLAVPVGATVRFPNSDPILHNVFSVSSGNDFDLGLYSRGPGKSATFHREGLVRVFCNVHQDMVAHIRVVGTPYVTTADSKGNFRFTDLPDGPGTLTVWHERSEDLTLHLDGSDKRLGTIELEASRPRVPQHLNKTGDPYKQQGRRRY
jgi:plastocyanin